METGRLTQRGRMLRGRAAEFRVMSELLLMNIDVSQPAIDTGVDLIAFSERIQVRIQVKSAVADPRGQYHFTIGSSAYRDRRARFLHESVDFVVCWGIDEDRFWIVPASLLKRAVRLTLGGINEPKKKIWVYEATSEKIEEMHNSGMTYGQIGKHFGLCVRTILKKKLGTPTRGYPCVLAMKKYENAWDSIREFLVVGKQIEAAHAEVPTAKVETRESYV